MFKALVIAFAISVSPVIADETNPFTTVAEQYRAMQSDDYRRGFEDGQRGIKDRENQLNDRQAKLDAYKDKIDAEKDDFYGQKHDPYLNVSPVAQASQPVTQPKKSWWKKAAKASGDNLAASIWGSNTAPAQRVLVQGIQPPAVMPAPNFGPMIPAQPPLIIPIQPVNPNPSFRQY
jgi:hypothetical protein